VKVKVLFFAALREQVGVASEDIDLPGEKSTIAALRSHLAARGGAWASALA
jgi:molybdopterin synthase sulfur carrier subunit